MDCAMLFRSKGQPRMGGIDLGLLGFLFVCLFVYFIVNRFFFIVAKYT